MSGRGQKPTSDSPADATSETGVPPGVMSLRAGRSASVALRQVQLIVDRGVELELKRRTLVLLAALARTPAFGPMCPHLVRTARSVGDATVERLNRQPAVHALADQRVKAPAEPVDLDDVAGPDSLKSHPRQRTRASGGPPLPQHIPCSSHCGRGGGTCPTLPATSSSGPAHEAAHQGRQPLLDQ